MTEQPRILIKAGPSFNDLTKLEVNHDLKPLKINSDNFEGAITVRIEDYLGPSSEESLKTAESGYFKKNPRVGMTWSIGVQGKFKETVSTNNVLFGNAWKQPIKDSLPYGASLGINFVKILDPSLMIDIYSDTPTAFSPLIATMNYFRIEDSSSSKIDWNPEPIEDDVTPLLEGEHAHLKGDAKGRKAFFAIESNRESVQFTPDTVISCDFVNGYLDFSSLSLKLPILSFPLKPRWDGQPITFVCKSRAGKVFFVITFDIVEDEKSQAIEVVEAEEDDLGVD